VPCCSPEVLYFHVLRRPFRICKHRSVKFHTECLTFCGAVAHSCERYCVRRGLIGRRLLDFPNSCGFVFGDLQCSLCIQDYADGLRRYDIKGRDYYGNPTDFKDISLTSMHLFRFLSRIVSGNDSTSRRRPVLGCLLTHPPLSHVVYRTMPGKERQHQEQ
jgi:hypothetical protein